MINTLTDDTNDMAQEIISAALIACKAIDILKEIKPGEALTPGPMQDQWKATLDQLNRASVTLEVKASWLRGEYRLQRSRPEEEAQFQRELAEMVAQEREGEEEE